MKRKCLVYNFLDYDYKDLDNDNLYTDVFIECKDIYKRRIYIYKFREVISKMYNVHESFIYLGVEMICVR